jgi:tetratricopeptide (TPR) repeat protein
MLRPALCLILLMTGRPVDAQRRASPIQQYALLIRKSQYRQVVRQVNAQLEQNPDDPELQAVLGVAWGRAGYFADAAGAFALCAGSAYYEDQGLPAHADALAVLGEPLRAVALREQRMLSLDLDDTREVRLLLNMADDYRLAGRTDLALDTAERALAIWPNAPVTWAVMADVWLDLGRIDEAEEALWQAQLLGGTTRGALVAARLALWQGDPIEALAQAEAALDYNMGSVRPAAIKAEALRRQGDLDAALEIIERTNWRLTEDPEMMAARIRVRTDRREWSEASEAADRARAVYAHHPEVQSALVHFDRAPR